MKSVKIGEQVWTKRNLKVDHYRNGDIIPEVQCTSEWADLETGAWCYYENKKTKKHGKLYNWYAINDPRGLAPKGWHIPTIEEFEILKVAVKDDGNSLKAVDEVDNNGIGTNTTGFSALLSGYRGINGHFYDLGDTTDFWSYTAYNETDAYNLTLYYDDSGTNLYGNGKENGFSIRLIKD